MNENAIQPDQEVPEVRRTDDSQPDPGSMVLQPDLGVQRSWGIRSGTCHCGGELQLYCYDNPERYDVRCEECGKHFPNGSSSPSAMLALRDLTDAAMDTVASGVPAAHLDSAVDRARTVLASSGPSKEAVGHFRFMRKSILEHYGPDDPVIGYIDELLGGIHAEEGKAPIQADATIPQISPPHSEV